MTIPDPVEQTPGWHLERAAEHVTAANKLIAAAAGTVPAAAVQEPQS